MFNRSHKNGLNNTGYPGNVTRNNEQDSNDLEETKHEDSLDTTSKHSLIPDKSKNSYTIERTRSIFQHLQTIIGSIQLRTIELKNICSPRFAVGETRFCKHQSYS